MPENDNLSAISSSDEDDDHSTTSNQLNDVGDDTNDTVFDALAKKREEHKRKKTESINHSALQRNYRTTMTETVRRHQEKVQDLLQGLLHEVNTLQTYIPVALLSAHQIDAMDKAGSLVQSAVGEVEREVAAEGQGHILETVFLLGEISRAEKQLEFATAPGRDKNNKYTREKDGDSELEQSRPQSSGHPNYCEHFSVSDGSRHSSPLHGIERPGRVGGEFGRQPEFREWMVVDRNGNICDKHMDEDVEDDTGRPRLPSVNRLFAIIPHTLFFCFVWFTQAMLELSWNCILEQFMAWRQLFVVLFDRIVQGCWYTVKRLGFKPKRWNLLRRTIPQLPKQTKHILLAHCSFLLNIAFCMVWLHRLDELLQANGHSRRQMLDYLYEGGECLVYRPTMDYMYDMISGFKVVVKNAEFVTGEARELIQGWISDVNFGILVKVLSMKTRPNMTFIPTNYL